MLELKLDLGFKQMLHMPAEVEFKTGCPKNLCS